MALRCTICDTENFSVPGKSFDMAFFCPHCRLNFCYKCAARKPIEYGIEALSCPTCGSLKIREAAIKLVVDDFVPLLHRPLNRIVVENLVGTRVDELSPEFELGHPEDERHHLICRSLGLQMNAGPERTIDTIFCLINGDENTEGYPWSFRCGLNAKSTRSEVCRILGPTERSGDFWDRFRHQDLGVVHVQYQDSGDGIDMITLMTPETAP